MWTKMRNLAGAMGELADVPNKVSAQIDTLKETETGQKLQALDARLGRTVSWAKSALWLAASLPALAVGYLAWASTNGWIAIALVGVAAVAFCWFAWRGLSHLLWPQTASAILVDELEGRVKPARWALTGLRAVIGPRRAAAD